MLIQQPRANYDIVVIGAGMVGASFALALQKKLAETPVSLLIVEAMKVGGAGQSTSPSFDDRSTALSYGSSKILQEAGIWENLAEQVTAIKNIHVSDRGHFGSARLNNEKQQVDALGYVVENRCLGEVLNESLQQMVEIDFLCPASIELIKPTAEGMQLKIASDNEKEFSIAAALVVLADGGRSPICGQLGIDIDTEQYQQKAIISNVAFQKPHRNIAFERFTETGPLAILPLPELAGENRGALVWTVNEADAEALMNLSEQEILPVLQERFGYRLGRITRIGKRICYPLSLAVAREQIRPGLVLLGNVAHTLHPVAGQGFNLALRDAESLADVLAHSHDNGQSLGSMEVLQHFLQQQSGDQARTIGFSHYMTRLFSNDRRALVWARKFGLASIDMLPGVKRSFARAAMGIADK
ncbi:MAG: 2-octaprenyl-6-methoxyphenyl hydroxylase [Gammaproteobacteria bacterium]|nr:2-octaprenyl-6-methoxyphenyl hydroxylase [Gammaproteobacteria bacterium]